MRRNPRAKELVAIPIVAVIVGVMVASVGGLEPWEAGCVMALVFAGLLGARFVKHRMAVADERTRRDIRLDENNRCNRCGGDLWGLDVKPAMGGKYQVMCGECGAVNVIAKPKRTKVSEPPKKKPFEDRGPFKFQR